MDVDPFLQEIHRLQKQIGQDLNVSPFTVVFINIIYVKWVVKCSKAIFITHNNVLVLLSINLKHVYTLYVHLLHTRTLCMFCMYEWSVCSMFEVLGSKWINRHLKKTKKASTAALKVISKLKIKDKVDNVSTKHNTTHYVKLNRIVLYR